MQAIQTSLNVIHKNAIFAHHGVNIWRYSKLKYIRFTYLENIEGILI